MQKIGREKIAITIAAVGLALCVSAGMAIAAKPGGGGHPSGGGGHPSGGGGHPGGGGGGAVHFNAAHVSAPHFNAAHFHAAPHFATHSHFTPHVSGIHGRHLASPSIHPHATSRLAHGLNRHDTHTTTLAHPLTTAGNAVANAAHIRPLAHAADPRFFAGRRRLAANAAFRPFWGHNWWHHGWHPYYHLGWIGPLFWPYAYGDFFYYALWPYDYEYADPFWVYGYGDIYEALFSPYDYQEYVQGSGAPARMETLTQNMAQSCDDEAAEVTGWPIDQIQSAVQPNPQQTALLDDLGNAIVEASHQIKIHCPTSVAFTPTARLDQMHQRLAALVDAANIISPPLTKLYDSLSDEQKARFNGIAPPNAQGNASEESAGEKPNVQSQCNANVMAWPADRIDSAIHPSDAQRAKLDGLQSALSRAADTIKAACSTEVPATPPDRLAAVANRLKAMLQGVATVQPVLAEFYNSLSDDQKARFNTMGKQLFTQNQE